MVFIIIIIPKHQIGDYFLSEMILCGSYSNKVFKLFNY